VLIDAAAVLHLGDRKVSAPRSGPTRSAPAPATPLVLPGWRRQALSGRSLVGHGVVRAGA
jgi:hypothetical protein